MIRPWTIIRIFLRCFLAYLALVLLWVVLPSPNPESSSDDGTGYSTSVLRAGRTLTRVYHSNDYCRIPYNWRNGERDGFALDYAIDMNTGTLFVENSSIPIPIVNLDSNTNSTELFIDVHARVGDGTGVSMEWFDFADDVLFGWWTSRQDNDYYMKLPLQISWFEETREEVGIYKMDLDVASGNCAPLLSLSVDLNDPSTLTASVPKIPKSSSPSYTYPIRLACILVVAPIAIFVNDHLESWIGLVFGTIGNALLLIVIIGGSVFLAGVLIVLIWRCVGGPSLADMVQGTQDRLDRLKENERLRFLRGGIEKVQIGVDWWYTNVYTSRVIDVCANGWHPEKEREMGDRDSVDMEGMKRLTLSKYYK